MASAGIITKIIGFFYRIPLANMLGEQGNGIYSVAFGIYNITLTLSSYSLPLAVSKMVSIKIARNEYKNSYEVFKSALVFAIVVGLFAFLTLYFGADSLEKLYDRDGLSKPLKVLAPTTLVMALLGVFRGYFQGIGDMIPTAISQIVEQIMNAIISILATVQLMEIYSNSDKVSAYSAAGGTVGTLAGAVSACLFLILLFIYKKPVLINWKEQDTRKTEKRWYITKLLLVTMVPVILSQTIYQIGYTIDDLIFGNIMRIKGYEDTVVSSLQGVFNTQYNQLINLPVAVTTAIAVAAIPSIVSTSIRQKKDKMNEKIGTVVKLNMVIALPAAVGLAVLAKPIVMLLFPRLVTYQTLAGNLLRAGSAAVVFYSLSTITAAVLQGNNYMRIPVIDSGISLVIHVVVVSGLLKFTNLGVYALIIGNVTFPLITSMLNCRYVTKCLKYRWEYRKTFIIPFFASGTMGIVACCSYKVLYRVLHSNGVSLIMTIFFAFMVYIVVLLKFKCFLKRELIGLPMGNKIIRWTKAE